MNAQRTVASQSGNAHRADPREMVKLAAFSVAAFGYIYLIGWLVTSVRLAAARLPVEASLPMIDDKVVFAAGLRTVLLMAVVFGAMCAVAYGAHAWTWTTRAPEWHEVIRSGRSHARAQMPNRTPRRGRALAMPTLDALKPQGPPKDLHEAKIGDPFVRVVAGFNVLVLGAALGLAAARIVQPLIDQVDPGQWWALFAPWAVVSLLAIIFFTLVGPLRGGRVLHSILWVLVAAVALLSTAPLGLLVLTWAGIATLGRVFGRYHTRPRSKVEFALSPMPWILLTTYALVGLAYYAVPPVSFAHTAVTTGSGTRTGGYLARTGTGVYLVSCTPLADATSTNEAVSVVPASQIKDMVTGGPTFSVNSGKPPSLPTPGSARVRGRCEQSDLDPPPTPSDARRLRRGSTTTAERRLRGTAAWHGGDRRTSAAERSRRRRRGANRADDTRDRAARSPLPADDPGDGCRSLLAGIGWSAARRPGCRWPAHLSAPRTPKCALSAPKPADLREQGSSPGDFLEYPAVPALDANPTGQLDAFLRGQEGLQTPVPSLHQWLANPGLLDPWNSAEVYFYYAGRADPSTWPSPDRDIPPGMLALQYWFFYQYNYYPTAATPDLMNDAPLAADVLNTDLHQGDWEHVTVLLDPKTLTPRWLYMARHSHEGQYYPWNSRFLSFDQGHPVVQAAFGGHPSYDAHCGERRRFIQPLDGAVSDWIVCGSDRFGFRAATTPLVDIAKAPWACWEGHFGVATQTEVGNARNGEGSVQRAIDANYFVAGPRSPLWQAENGRLTADGAPRDTGVCATSTPSAPERAVIQSGLGGAPAGLGHRPHRAAQ